MLALRLAVLCTIAASAQSSLADSRAPRAPDAPEPSTPDDTEAARSAFRRGAELARTERWDDAIAAFDEAYRLRPHPVTSYNLGYCERAVGHATRAFALFRRALAEHASGETGALRSELVSLSEEYAREAERRIARVRVRVADGDGRVAVDGRALEPLAMEPGRSVYLAGVREPGPAAPIPAREFETWVDPGVHLFVLERAGVPDAVVTRRVDPGSTALIDFERRPLAPVNAAATVTRDSWGVDRSWAYASFGLGAAGFAAALISGYQVLHKQAVLDEACGAQHRQCPESRRGDIDSLDRARTATVAGAVLGGAGVAAGLVLLKVFPERPSPADLHVSSVSLGFDGARLHFSKDF